MLKRKIAPFVILGLLLVLAAVPAHAEQENRGFQQMEIRVDIPVASNDADAQNDQGYVGYTREFLHEIAQSIGWQYEIVLVQGSYQQGLEKALNMLKDGQVG